MKRRLALTFILILLISINLTSSLFIIQPVKASVESIGTSCYLFAEDVVEPQPITVEVQIYPAPPEGEVFNDLVIIITSPLQGTVGNYPWGTGPWAKRFSSDTDGKATVIFEVHTFGGYWFVELSFGGQYFANETIYYEPLDAHRHVFVSSVETPTPSPTASPSPSPEPTSTPEPTPTPLPTPPRGEGMQAKQLMDFIIGGIASAVAIAVLVLLYYLTKRK
jgi:hypothetical protein